MSLRYLGIVRACSVVFLAAPWFIFFGAWLRPLWAIAASLLLGAVLLQYLRAIRTAPADDRALGALPTRDRIPVRALLTILVVALAWVSLSGAGGVGFQNLPDWSNKNVLMGELIGHSWPVVYDSGLTLNYYFALYLPASVVGRLAGWNAGQWMIYGEVLVGLILALLWLYSFSGKLGLKVLVIFIAFGGLDIVGYLITRHYLPRPGNPIEWWATNAQFSSVTTMLYWVPQHCLPGWILTSLILDDASRLRRLTFVGLFVGLCLLWSPFVTVGLVPVAVLAWTLAERKSLVSTANLVFWPAMMVLAYAFYAPHNTGSNIDMGPAIWAEHYSWQGARRLGALLAFEVGVYGLAILASWKSLDRSWRTMAVVVAISSVAWVLTPEPVGHGGFNMRSSIPTLLMLFWLVTHVLSHTTSSRVRWYLGACLVLGSVSAVQETTRSLLRYPTTIPAPPSPKRVMEMSARHSGEFLMPMDSRLYRFFYRTPEVPR